MNDQRLIRFLAEKVMRWPRYEDWVLEKQQAEGYYADNYVCYRERGWNPLDFWTDAGMLWEKAAKVGKSIHLELEPFSVKGLCRDWQHGELVPMLCADSGPHALSFAIARAFGYEEEGEEK